MASLPDRRETLGLIGSPLDLSVQRYFIFPFHIRTTLLAAYLKSDHKLLPHSIPSPSLTR